MQTTKATALTIAHRLTTIKDCDQILVLSDGRLVEQGTHSELLEIPVERAPPRGKQQEGQVVQGFYASQWQSMMGKKEEDATPTTSASSSTVALISDEDLEELRRNARQSREDMVAAQGLAQSMAKGYSQLAKELCDAKREAQLAEQKLAERRDQALAGSEGADTQMRFTAPMPPPDLARASSAPVKSLWMPHAPFRS